MEQKKLIPQSKCLSCGRNYV